MHEYKYLYKQIHIVPREKSSRETKALAIGRLGFAVYCWEAAAGSSVFHAKKRTVSVLLV
jgi:hypothetical protein